MQQENNYMKNNGNYDATQIEVLEVWRLCGDGLVCMWATLHPEAAPAGFELIVTVLMKTGWFCDVIKVILHSDGSVTVCDNGREYRLIFILE